MHLVYSIYYSIVLAVYLVCNIALFYIIVNSYYIFYYFYIIYIISFRFLMRNCVTFVWPGCGKVSHLSCSCGKILMDSNGCRQNRGTGLSTIKKLRLPAILLRA